MDVRAPDRVDDLLAGDEIRQNARRSRTATSPPSKPATTSARRPRSPRRRSKSSRRRSTPGEYRNVDGTQALALGLIAASVKSGLQLFFATYPITPASELLHHLARHDRFGVRTVQAEDEIAAANMALGAAFAGHLGITATSGPGMDLKAETIGLAAMLELPMVIVDVQRAGPSTGMPTKTEQTDLLMAIHGRHGESPLPVIAASTPADCFDAAVEAVRVAVRYRTPVILLSDTFLANSSEPWRIPDSCRPARDRPRLRRGPERRRRVPALPARRARRPPLGDPRHARPPAPARRPREGERQRQHQLRPGQPRADDRTARQASSRSSPRRLPELEVEADEGAELLVLGWGSTYGVDPGRRPAGARTRRSRSRPPTCATSTRCRATPARSSARFPKVLIPEINTGQLLGIIRGEFLVDAVGYNKIEGLPIFAEELEGAILEALA